MAKKDFTAASKRNVFDSMMEAAQEAPVTPEEQVTPEAQDTYQKKQYKPRKTYNAEEQAEFMSESRTSGRKGLALPRINLALQPQLHDYVFTMSRVSGITMTAFVNKLVKEHMDEHMDIYEAALRFRDSI